MMRTATTEMKSKVAGSFAMLSRQITFNGYLLFGLGASLIGSGFTRTRIEVRNLQIHPYLVAVLVLLPLLAISRFSRVPVRLSTALLLFAGLYFATTFQGFTGASIVELVKIGGSIATILTMLLLVNSWADFAAGVTGMALAVGVLAAVGLDAGAGDYESGINAIESANRNAYSLYALPPILLGGYILIRGKTDSLLVKGVIALSLLASSLAIVINLNRSGWLGLGVIILMLIYQKSMKAAVLFALFGSVTFFVVTSLFTISHLQARIDETRSGLDSDKHRRELIIGSIKTAVEHPLLGVSPQELPYYLGAYLGEPGAAIYPHNVFAHMIGGSGVLCFFLMLNIGAVLWRWNIPRTTPPAMRAALKEARTLTRLVLLLWFVRGNFTHEIIYSPSFNMALGLCAGLCILYSGETQSGATRAVMAGRRSL